MHKFEILSFNNESLQIKNTRFSLHSLDEETCLTEQTYIPETKLSKDAKDHKCLEKINLFMLYTCYSSLYLLKILS